MLFSLSWLRTISSDEKDSLSIHSIGGSMELSVHGIGPQLLSSRGAVLYVRARVQYLCFAAAI